ncbi:hypothetical protein SEA_MARKY_79 [Streptomyces phage Marky]|nr:hypothetical protein SEA_MARKY_79 [Streptomyces phage Marky]
MNRESNPPTYELDAEIRLLQAAERRPAEQVSPEWGPNPFCMAAEHSDECPSGCVYDDDPTQCIDGDGYPWPEHDESGTGECRRCGAELEV